MPKRPLNNIALKRRAMRKFFARKVKEFYPSGTILKRLIVTQHGHFEFKSAISYELILETPDGERARRIIRGNVPSPDTSAALAVGTKVQKDLYNQGFAFGHYRVPLSLGYFPKLRLGLYENFPGTTLLKSLTYDHLLNVKAIRLSAAWLAKFHQSGVSADIKRTKKHIRLEQEYFIRDFRRCHPQALAPAKAIMNTIANKLEQVINRRRKYITVTHGDFHPANIIIHPSRSIGIIDFGNCSNFDPLSDVASFMAQVDRLAWDHEISQKRADRTKHIFLNKYAAKSHQKLSTILPIINHYYIWWIMQILAYSVVIRSMRAQRRLVQNGIRQAIVVMDQLGYKLNLTNINDTSNPATLNHQLTDYETMFNFFNTNLEILIPEAQHIISLEMKQPKALSRTSYLTWFSFLIINHQEERERITIRGNYIPEHTYKLLKHLSRYRHLRVIRPIYYLKNTSYFFYNEIKGNSLRRLSGHSKHYKKVLRSIAEVTARLHSTSLVHTRPWTAIDEKKFINSKLAIIRQRDVV
ncbi:aminoglycoside phosphotransferase family protein, partial [Patescibacteria group bacterium]